MDIYWRRVLRKDALDLKISVVFNQNNIDLKVFEENNSWKANITESNLRKFAERFDIQLSNYMNNIKKYLTQPLDNIEIILIKDTFQIKIILENQMKTIYFETTMMKVDFTTNILTTVDNLFSVKKQYFNDLNDLKIENKKLQEDKIELEGKLNEFFKNKKIDEEELLSKFVVLLNEKKRQIQHLNDLLIAFKHERPVTNPIILTKKGKVSMKALSKTKDIPHKSNTSSDESDSSKSYQSEIEEQPILCQEKVLEPSEGTSINIQQKRELMGFSDDSPSVNLTKRLRQENVDFSSTFSSHNSKKEIIEKDNIPTRNDIADETPVVTYNTQDLLDNF